MSANTQAVNQMGSLSVSDRVQLVRVIESLEASIAALQAVNATQTTAISDLDGRVDALENA